MTSLAPTLEAFFTDRLINQRQASPNTVTAYRHTFRLLVGFLHDRTGTPPCKLDLGDLDEPAIAAFLEHLETRSTQQRADPQRPPRRHPLLLQLRGRDTTPNTPG